MVIVSFGSLKYCLVEIVNCELYYFNELHVSCAKVTEFHQTLSFYTEFVQKKIIIFLVLTSSAGNVLGKIELWRSNI